MHPYWIKVLIPLGKNLTDPNVWTVVCICLFLLLFVYLMVLIDLISSGSLSAGNGEFGDWNTFSSTSPPAVTAPSAIPGLFSDVPAPAAPVPTSTQPASTDLFDLMTPNNSSLSASQSMTFNMCPQNTTTPLSRSQVNVGLVCQKGFLVQQIHPPVCILHSRYTFWPQSGCDLCMCTCTFFLDHLMFNHNDVAGPSWETADFWLMTYAGLQAFRWHTHTLTFQEWYLH